MKKHVALLTIFTFALALCAFAQTAPLQITNGPRVEGTGNNWAVIAWTTNAGGSSIVRYGTSPNSLTQTAESPYSGAKIHQGQVTHRVRINNLQPGMTYYFAVDSGQGSGTGTSALSSVAQFTTKGTNASGAYPGAYPAGATAAQGEQGENENHAAVRITDGPRVEGTANNWAVIAWTTNVASSSVIHYGTSPNNLTQIAQAPYSDNESANQQTHRVHINNLRPHTTYYFRVDSGQAEGTGTQSQSNISQFTTK